MGEPEPGLGEAHATGRELKCLYLVTRSLDPTGRGKAGWVTRWKPSLNAFAITFEGRLELSNTN